MENQEEKTEIILPTESETQALAVPCQLHWKDVRYNIAVFIRKVGNPLAGESIVADHVFGRCMGERSDGKGFFTSSILPWIWEDDYNWRITARARLDSFLLPECKCDSRTEETKVCEFHLELIGKWESDDRKVMEHTRAEARKMPPAREGGGVFEQGKVMHKDYPWCREQEGRYMCTICGYGKDPREALGNPTYRNVFIRDHSHCGFGNPEQHAPKPFGKIAMLPKEVFDHLKAVQGEVERISGSGNLLQEFKEAQNIQAPDQYLFSGKTAQPAFRRATAVCQNCFRGVYKGDDGLLYHLDLMRACHWGGTTVATA
jgi:hypothetical protein